MEAIQTKLQQGHLNFEETITNLDESNKHLETKVKEKRKMNVEVIISQ